MIFNYLETERDHRTSPQSDTYQDEVRTLFVSGLPSDVKQRELHLLFRAYKGKYNFRFNFLLRIGTIKSLSVDSVPHHATDAENLAEIYRRNVRSDFVQRYGWCPVL